MPMRLRICQFIRNLTYNIGVATYQITLCGAYFQRVTEVVMDLELIRHKNIGIWQTRGLAFIVILVVPHLEGIFKEGFFILVSLYMFM